MVVLCWGTASGGDGVLSDLCDPAHRALRTLLHLELPQEGKGQLTTPEGTRGERCCLLLLLTGGKFFGESREFIRCEY